MELYENIVITRNNAELKKLSVTIDDDSIEIRWYDENNEEDGVGFEIDDNNDCEFRDIKFFNKDGLLTLSFVHYELIENVQIDDKYVITFTDILEYKEFKKKYDLALRAYKKQNKKK